MRAEQSPDRVFAVFEDDEAWTFRETAERSWRCGRGFQRLGLRQGEILVAWLPNGREALLSWFGAASAGLTYTPLNTGYRGPLLENALKLLSARVIVVHAGLIERLVELDLPSIETLVVIGDIDVIPSGLPKIIPWTDLVETGEVDPPILSRPIEPWDDQMIMFTGGTTGASKAVRRPHILYLKMTESCFDRVGVNASDRFLVCAPMFHGGADIPIYAMLRNGGSIAIIHGFRTEKFWDDVRRYRCSVAWIHSTMCLFLWQQPRRDDDDDHPLRLAMQAPLLPDIAGFCERFGIRLYTGYGMTEIPWMFSVLDPKESRTLGKPVDPDFELRLVDEYDRPVADGTPGQLVVRHRVPWAITPGYYRNAEATAAAWRNGWFHSGDVLTRDSDGNYSIVDRVKDSIRRRGENVSAAEVEREILANANVAEAAVIGVEAELEQEVMAFVVPTSERSVTGESLTEFLIERLPYYAVPRYIEFVESLPLNAAFRVDKPVLRQRGISLKTWDRERAGIRLRRERL